MSTPERAIEEDVKLGNRQSYYPPRYLLIRPAAGNGAIIMTGGNQNVLLTVEEREKVARALWPDAFKGDR